MTKRISTKNDEKNILNILKEMLEESKPLPYGKKKVVWHGLNWDGFCKYSTPKMFKNRRKYLLHQRLITKIKTDVDGAYYSITPLGIVYLLKNQEQLIKTGFLNISKSEMIFNILESFYRYTTIHSVIVPTNKEINANNLLHGMLPFVGNNASKPKLKVQIKKEKDEHRINKNIDNSLALDHVLDKFVLPLDPSNVQFYIRYGRLKLDVALLQTNGESHVTEFTNFNSNSKKITLEQYHTYFAFYLIIMFLFSLGDLIVTRNIRLKKTIPVIDSRLLKAVIYFHNYLAGEISYTTKHLNEIRRTLNKL